MNAQSLILSLVFSAPYNHNYKMETSVTLGESCHHYLTPKTSLNGSELLGLRHILQQHLLSISQSEDSLMMILAFDFLKQA